MTKKKFLRLPDKTRASKMALLLKDLLESSHLDQELIKEYEQYQSWIKPPYPGFSCRDLFEQYHFWNAASGHNRGLIQSSGNTDRQRRRGPLIAWKAALNSIRSGYNVGSIIRTSDAFGFNEILLGGTTPDAGNRAVKSSAMGAQQWVKQRRIADLEAFIKKQKELENRQIVGLELTSRSIALSAFSVMPSGIIVVGNEEKGIEIEIREICDQLIYIPMSGRKNSLNVSAAFAITAYHIRQHYQSATRTGKEGFIRQGGLLQ